MDDWSAYLAVPSSTLNDLRKTALACTRGLADMVAHPFGRRERIARAVRALAVAALCAATATSSQMAKGTRNDREDAGGDVAGTGALEAFGDGARHERPGRQTRRDVLLCHVMLRVDVFQIRIEPNSATASRDLRMNGATARKDAGGAVAGTGAPGAFLEDRQSGAGERHRPHHRSRDPAITAREPEHRAACQYAHTV